jgi:hypothetical protein
MLRGVLIAYLVLFTAAGPCLCCCAALRTHAATRATPPAEPATPAAPCCQRHHRDATPAAAPERPAPAGDPTAPDPKQPCPCRDHPARRGKMAVTSAAAGELSLLRWSLQSPLAATLAADPPAADPPAALPDLAAVDNPFLSADQLLHVQHRLRC